jgi:hypothetical protein
MPLVIVCSQYRNYYGTSVTNALEIIAEALFDEIARNNIDGVSFENSLPIIKEWHFDANCFDKFLATVYPTKYGNRFSTWRLDMGEIFSRIIWIENYPIDKKSFSFDKHVNVVTLDTSGSPTWHGRPTDKWLVEQTGFSIEELLPPDENLDLDNIETRIESYPSSVEELQSFPGYHQVRWTKELLDFLPGLLSSARAYRGRAENSDLEELSIHDEIEKFLAVKLPARELFEREFKFSKKLGIHTSGREKSVDFALFSPTGDAIDSFLEVKRTSSATPDLQAEVRKDIARLLLLSKKFQCSCYLLVCGDATAIESQLSKMAYLSLADEDKARDRRYAISSKDFGQEYSALLDKFQVELGVSKLQGKTTSGSNLSALWQIGASEADFKIHKPYTFTLGDIKRG